MQLTGAQIIIECLKEQRTQTLFGYPGGTVLSVYDALYERGDGIRHILTTHEQGAAHAADGYARATGRTGVCLVTSGPGATNLVTGIATAYMDSSPIVAITINVPVASLGRDSFQEIDIAGITIPVTKHNFIVKDVTQLADCLRRAFRVARSGRPGPVLVDIARDVTESECEFEPMNIGAEANGCKGNFEANGCKGNAVTDGCKGNFEANECKGNAQTGIGKIPANELGKTVTALIHSKKPIIIAGGGCTRSGAGESLTKFAGEFEIPVVDTMMGRGAIPGRSPLALGMGGIYGTPAAVRAMKDCDLMIAVGCRFSDRLTGENCEFIGDCKIIHIDIDKAEIDKNVRSDISLQADADSFFRAILPVMKKRTAGKNVSFSKWAESLGRIKAETQRSEKIVSETMPLTGDTVAKVVGDVVGGDAVYVTEVGECQISAVNSISYERTGSLITSGGLGTMGFGLGAAIGAKAGCPERTVVNFAGDGSFRMNMAEIMTAVTNNLPFIEVVFDNGILGMVHTMQKERFGAHYIATELDDSFSYVNVARALGAKSYDCTTVKELRAAVKEALTINSKYVNVIVCHMQ
ncbi:MAG: biosynthetic-type acetolactate synthase large subunit [Lachnospiraceae bacterium]|nr:biosynthetic-type acetolactate synthase large subunit [Lachnospiraceae bacterium]